MWFRFHCQVKSFYNSNNCPIQQQTFLARHIFLCKECNAEAIRTIRSNDKTCQLLWNIILSQSCAHQLCGHFCPAQENSHTLQDANHTCIYCWFQWSPPLWCRNVVTGKWLKTLATWKRTRFGMKKLSNLCCRCHVCVLCGEFSGWWA